MKIVTYWLKYVKVCNRINFFIKEEAVKPIDKSLDYMWKTQALLSALFLPFYVTLGQVESHLINESAIRSP
ncbi:hypothetical protein Y1Q_0015944 [Alligator mississippiensis]|uniref:Uncharacterized protein n=1 Tax=Alligator mississippiensis TaxID=8496 RepID=A0A151MV27_ALLMI|nr:hypothetical protein Y1Q_0015944 [Alligator mississippiensis]